MWIFMSGVGFFSLVEQRDDQKLVRVRSRIDGDLQKLKEKFLPNLGEITEQGKGADYPYVALAWRTELAEAMQKAVMAIDYTNFKSGISRTQGSSRHDLYMKVWSAMKDAEATLRRFEKEDEEREKNPEKFYSQSSGSSWVSVHNPPPSLDDDDDKLVVRNGKHIGFQQWLDIKGSRKAREDRLRDKGQSADMRRADIEAAAERHREQRIRNMTKEEREETEAARKRIEALVSGQLKGGPSDFDREFGDEVGTTSPSNWNESVETYAQGMSSEDEIDPTIDREKK